MMSAMLPTCGRWCAVWICAAIAVAALQGCGPRTPAPERRHLLIVVDGLRPDYVTGDVMPNLAALGARGVVFTRHHSVYPTVTRVNAASISTGSYPERHGLLGNSVFFPKVDATKFLDTADRQALVSIGKAEGQLLTAPTLGESLQQAGHRLLVVSSGSAGSAFLLNHTVAGGAILHGDYALPETLGSALAAIGPAARSGAPPGARDGWVVDAFLKVGLPQVDPAVTIMWLGELDATAHDHGIGAAATVEVLRHVDAAIRRIEDGLRAAGVFDRYNIWVTSDHGFTTYTGGIDLAALLAPHTRTGADSQRDVVAGGGAIYLRDGKEQLPAIVGALQQTPGAGAIFTRGAQPGSLDGSVPGTLSFDAARWAHDRSADILFSPDWTDEANANGWRGTSRSNGIAGHGSTSPRDIRNTLIAAGPDLKRGATFASPSANADFAPTFLTLLGLAVPASMQGRPLDEAFTRGAAPTPASVRTTTHTARTGDGSYAVTATFSIVTRGGSEHRYLDEAKVERKTLTR